MVSDDGSNGETDGGELDGMMGPYGLLSAVGCTDVGSIMLGEVVARESSTSPDGCRVAVPSVGAIVIDKGRGC